MAHLDDGFLKILFDNKSNDIERKKVLPFANSEIYYTNIIQAVKLTEGEDVKDIYDVAIDIKNISFNFQPGDTIGILPNNNVEEVNKIIECLNCADLVDKNCKIILLDEKKKRLAAHLPVNTTLKNVLLKHVDIRSPPKKTFLRVLIKYTENEEEKQLLEKLASPSNSEEYITFISKNARTLQGLLTNFPSCKAPIERILEHLPPLQPRPYSISSSPLLEQKLHIIFSVEYFDKETETKGVCTGWLESIIAPLLKSNGCFGCNQQNISFYFRKPNFFRLNSDISTPIIMIGPGTGIAPFLGFLQHLYLKQKTLSTWLFYGCRYKNRDYLYKHILEKYLNENYLAKLSVAFSRDQDIKHYVQDLIKNEPAQIYNQIVNGSALVYVCGDIKDMMKSVKDSIKYCLINNGMSVNTADSFISEMVRTNKYIEDKWI